MFSLIERYRLPPTKAMRYCCRELKETAAKTPDFIITGVRQAESIRRRDRGVFESVAKKKSARVILWDDNSETRRTLEACPLTGGRIVNPILDWSDVDVWGYLKGHNVHTNPLYDCGFHRIGCIGCPMATTRDRYHHFLVWPTYKDAYMRAFAKMLNRKREQGGMVIWKNEEEVFHWWMNDGVVPGQINITNER